MHVQVCPWGTGWCVRSTSTQSNNEDHLIRREHHCAARRNYSRLVIKPASTAGHLHECRQSHVSCVNISEVDCHFRPHDSFTAYVQQLLHRSATKTVAGVEGSSAWVRSTLDRGTEGYRIKTSCCRSHRRSIQTSSKPQQARMAMQQALCIRPRWDACSCADWLSACDAPGFDRA